MYSKSMLAPLLLAEAEKRRYPRYELYASVKVRANDDILVLSVRNISLGGVYLESRLHHLAHFPVGSVHDLLVFDAEDDDSPPVRAPGRVLRQEDDGLAMQWTGDDVSRQIGELLNQLRPRR